MAHDYKEEIICPYCDYEFGDSWEYDGDSGRQIECCECGKNFNLSVDFEVSYSTSKIDCEDDGCDFGEPRIDIIDQETINRWNDDETLKCLHNQEPHKLLIRECKNCDNKDYKKQPLN